MSSKARSVEHGGVVWKVIPGSRREQLLMRFIRQDNALHHADVAAEPDDDYGLEIWLPPLVGGFLVGFSAGVLVGWGAVG